MPKTAKQSRQKKLILYIMKTFDELFQEAAKISDKRTAIFNQLIKKTENEIIPAFVKMMNGYGLSKTFFTMYVNPFSGFDSQKDEEGADFWAFGLENDGLLLDCEKDLWTGRYETYKAYRLKNNESDLSLPVARFTRSGIAQLVKLLNNRIEELNKKYALKVEEAETLLK